MLVTVPIPNLISGVSQQAPTMRFPSQANEQINCQSSLIEGLTKRAPTKHIVKAIDSTAAGVDKTFVHIVNRDPTERYVVLVRGDIGYQAGRLVVRGIDGTNYTVNYDPGTQQYLDCTNPSDEIRMMTVADYTFVLNRTKTVAMDSVLTATRGHEALVTVVAGNYESTYTLVVDTVTSTYTTSATDIATISTKHIAQQLVSGLSGLVNFSVTRVGSVIWIKKNDASDFTVSYTDSQSNRSMALAKGEVSLFTDLPRTAPDGFVVKVNGDPEAVDEEYWIAFRCTDGSQFGIGVWEETFAPQIEYALDLETMPHTLIREVDVNNNISFRLKQGTWAERTVGDDVTARTPSFVDRTISDIFFFKNRLGFLGKYDKVLMSETGQYFNFWRTTVITVVDSDPIDISVAHNRVSELQAAIPFNDRLILFSELTQFSLSSTGQILSPATVQVTQTTEFEASMRAKPVATGRSIVFAQTRGAFSGIREYVQDLNTDNYEAIDLTANVSSYLIDRVLELDVSTNVGMAVVRTDYPEIIVGVDPGGGPNTNNGSTTPGGPDVGNPNYGDDGEPPGEGGGTGSGGGGASEGYVTTEDENGTLYIYKWFINGSEKIQSSWSKWSFPDSLKVIGLGWIDTDLYLIILRTDGVYLETMRVQDNQVDGDLEFTVHLDRRVGATGLSATYDSVTDTTSITVPYAINAATFKVVNGGESLAATIVDAETGQVTLNGNQNFDTLYAGVSYPMSYTMGTPFVRAESRAMVSGRLGLTYGKIVFSRTAYFSVAVNPRYRGLYRHEWSSQMGDVGTYLSRPLVLQDGEFTFPIHAKNNEVRITIENDTHLPCRLMSAEIEGTFVARSRAV